MKVCYCLRSFCPKNACKQKSLKWKIVEIFSLSARQIHELNNIFHLRFACLNSAHSTFHVTGFKFAAQLCIHFSSHLHFCKKKKKNLKIFKVVQIVFLVIQIYDIEIWSAISLIRIDQWWEKSNIYDFIVS